MAIIPKTTSTTSQTAMSKFTVVSNQLGPLVTKATSLVSVCLKTSKAVLDKYPPVKAFVYTLAGASAVPVAVFTGYAATTFGGVLAVAGTVVTFVQGCILLFGSFVLSWFILGALILAAFSSFWFTAAYFTLQVAKRVESKF